MSSIKDTFSSKGTTPFERQRDPSDTFNSSPTTPFKGRRARRASTLDIDSEDLEIVETSSEAHDRHVVRWLVMACMTFMLGMALWAVSGD